MYYTLQGQKEYDYNFSQEGSYRRSVPSNFPPHLRKKKEGTDRNDLRGKVCPSCGTTRSMMNKCECNS